MQNDIKINILKHKKLRLSKVLPFTTVSHVRYSDKSVIRSLYPIKKKLYTLKVPI